MNDFLESIPADSLKGISLGLMTDATVRRQSAGRVSTDVLYISQSGRPHPEGLLSSHIFGCRKPFTCDCGRYSRMPAGRTEFSCPHCKTPLTPAILRRSRMAHIELPGPVVHPWHLYQAPFLVAELLGLSPSTVARLANGQLTLVQAGLPDLAKGSLIPTDDFQQRWTTLVHSFYSNNRGDSFPYTLKFATGGRAIQLLLERVNLEELDHKIETAIIDPAARAALEKEYEWLHDPFGEAWRLHARRLKEARQHVPENLAARAIPVNAKTLIRRQGVIRSFMRTGIKPVQLTFNCLPVIPPDLRPQIPSGNAWINSDLNNLYRDVLAKVRRFQTLLRDYVQPITATGMAYGHLQASVNALFDNGCDNRPTMQKKRPLKGLVDRLMGKEGRFRKNLFGKRVNFSGRTVITSGPDLAIDEVGLPFEMARELFAPFTAKELIDAKKAVSPRAALRMISRNDPIALSALEKVMGERSVLLNRAPSLHRHSVQAFRPVLKYGTRAMTLNNVVLGGFNADYDGDQMGVHVPLGAKALAEAKGMRPENNMLAPATGQPMHGVGQEAVLGLYYLTLADPLPEGARPRVFSDPLEAHAAWEAGQLKLHQPIEVRLAGKRQATTYGRMVLWEALPAGIPVPDKPLSKKVIGQLLATTHAQLGSEASSKLLIAFRDLGFYWSTRGGLSFGIEDLRIPPDKWEIVQKAKNAIDAMKADPSVPEGARFEREIQLWADCTEKVLARSIEEMKNDRAGKNPFFMMYDSGARGTKLQVRQVSAMRGLFTTIAGRYVKHPVLANLREGQSTYDYIVSCHGTRKSFGDMALRTADAGYLTRRLVDAGHDISITSADCGDTDGLAVQPILNAAGEVVVGLAERIAGRILTQSLTVEGRTFPAGKTLTEADAKFLGSRVASGHIRHPLTCKDPEGLCQACYGLDLTTKAPPILGLAVGVIAGQAVGEPATQMTLRSKHTGGVSEIKATEKPTLKAPVAGQVHMSEPQLDGLALSHSNRVVFATAAGTLEVPVPMGTQLTRESAKAGDPVADLPIQEVLLAPLDGDLAYQSNRLLLKTAAGEIELPLWGGMRPLRTEGHVRRGEPVALGAGQGISARDITGGLPRINAILEMRNPKGASVLAPSRGAIHIGPIQRKMRLLTIELPSGTVEVPVPARAKLLVVEGQVVKPGMPLTEGDAPLKKLMKYTGATRTALHAVSSLLLEYRDQGISVNPIHFEVLLTAMSRFYEVTLPSGVLTEGQTVSLRSLKANNAEGKQRVLGLIQAALNQDGFLAAASFQRTRSVLYQAAIRAQVDNLKHRKTRLMIGMRV